MAKSKKSNKDEKTFPALADELGINDVSEPIVCGLGKLFSVAGRESPVIEITHDSLIIRPPQLPLSDEAEAITVEHASDRGVLLNAFGHEVTVAGAKYKGHQLYVMFNRNSEGARTVAYFDNSKAALYPKIDNQIMTYETAIQRRNLTVDGEIS